MKDYSNNIMVILESNLELDKLPAEVKTKFSHFSKVSRAVKELNTFIQTEVCAMQSEIVVLTEQLMENDTLLIEHKKN